MALKNSHASLSARCALAGAAWRAARKQSSAPIVVNVIDVHIVVVRIDGNSRRHLVWQHCPHVGLGDFDAACARRREPIARSSATIAAERRARRTLRTAEHADCAVSVGRRTAQRLRLWVRQFGLRRRCDDSRSDARAHRKWRVRIAGWSRSGATIAARRAIAIVVCPAAIARTALHCGEFALASGHRRRRPHSARWRRKRSVWSAAGIARTRARFSTIAAAQVR